MKHIFLFFTFLIAAFTQCTYAQACDGQRYYNPVFSGYDSSSVIYSNNNMTMDIYQPHGDTATHRKAILMIHGGNFYEGSSKDPFIYHICQQYVQKGYVAVSINYTLISDSLDLTGALLDSTTAYPIIAQTISDGKAAVRYLKKNGASLGIDTSWIVIGGEASGALIADHIAYMKSYSPSVPLFDSAFAALGGLDGNSGNPGYSTKVKAVLNFGGGLLNLDMLTHLDNEPIFTAQGDSDHTIPYECGLLFDYYTNYQACGGGAMQPVLNSLGIMTQLEHYDSLDSAPWNDTILSGPQQGRLIQPMVDAQTALFLYQIDCPAFAAIQEINTANARIYPNPASTGIYVESSTDMESIDIINYMGQIIHTVYTTGDKSQIDISTFAAGIYIARLNLKDKISVIRPFMVE